MSLHTDKKEHFMTHHLKKKHLKTFILLCISLFIINLPSFANQGAQTMDNFVGSYSGTLIKGERGAFVHLTIQKISSSTGLVTLEGTEGQTTPIKYYMTYNPDTEVTRFYPNEVATTGNLDSPYIFEGYCGDGMIAGLHAFYGLDPDTNSLEDSFTFFKDKPEIIHLNKGILNSKIDLPNQVIQPEVNGSSLKNASIRFHEYSSHLYSMRVSFTAQSPQANYYYMLSLPEAINTISVGKSPVKLNASTYKDDFGRYIATTLSGDFYGPLSYTDVQTQTRLKDTYKGSLLSTLSEDSVLGRAYHHYDTFHGVLSGHTQYELEFLFTGSLESFFQALETSPASFYIGGKEGELLLDNFAPIENEWRDLLGQSGTKQTEDLNLEGDYIKGVTISSSELTNLLTDSIDGIDRTPEVEILDEEKITFNGMTRDVSLAKSSDYYIMAIQNSEDRDDEFFGIFDNKYNTKMLATKQNDIIIMELYFDDKVVVCDSIDKGDHYTYNEYSLVGYKSSEKLKTLKDFSLSVLDKHVK
jgi:hypothetical protein